MPFPRKIFIQRVKYWKLLHSFLLSDVSSNAISPEIVYLNPPEAFFQDPLASHYQRLMVVMTQCGLGVYEKALLLMHTRKKPVFHILVWNACVSRLFSV